MAAEEVLPPATIAHLLPLGPPVRAATGQILAGPTSSSPLVSAGGDLWLLGQLSCHSQPFSGPLQASYRIQSIQGAKETDHSDLACSFLEQKVGAHVEVSRPSAHCSGPALKVVKRNIEVPHGCCLRM